MILWVFCVEPLLNSWQWTTTLPVWLAPVSWIHPATGQKTKSMRDFSAEEIFGEMSAMSRSVRWITWLAAFVRESSMWFDAQAVWNTLLLLNIHPHLIYINYRRICKQKNDPQFCSLRQSVPQLGGSDWVAIAEGRNNSWGCIAQSIREFGAPTFG